VIYVNLGISLTLTATLSWTCLPTTANALPTPDPTLATPTATLSLTTGSTGPVDQDNRATEVGLTASFTSTGTQSLSRPSAGLIGGEATSGGTILLGPSPSIVVSAHAEASGTVPDTVLPSQNSNVGFGQEVANAAGTLRYQFEIFDPLGPNTTNPVDLNVDGTIGAAGVSASQPAFASSNEEIEVSDLSGNLLVADYLFATTNPPLGQGNVFLRHIGTDSGGILKSFDDSNYAGSSYHEKGTYRFQTNQVYSVHLVATAGAIIHVEQVNAAAITVSGFVDPVFTLVGPNTGNLKLVFSGGVGNASPVPVPASAWLAMSGLGVLLGFGKKRTTKRG
jgi:hypothetical protein